MEIIEASDFSAEDAAALSDGEADPYETDHLAISWAPKDRHVLLFEDGQLVAHAGYLLIEVQADGMGIPGVGLGSVMVRRPMRGHGIGPRLVQETTSRMSAVGRSFALLFCRDVRLRFYERMGWQRVLTPVTVEQQEGPIVMPLFTCWFSFDEKCPPPTKHLQVVGPPF